MMWYVVVVVLAVMNMAFSDESVVAMYRDPYRDHMYDEGEKDTVWRYGAPPDYSVVNKLFEEGRTHVWLEDSIEGKVQRMVKTWEMELLYKICPKDYKTVNAETFEFAINGRTPVKLDYLGKEGGYNEMLKSKMPDSPYDPSNETFESSLKIFNTMFPRGFALEILQLYSDASPFVFKFRHWAYMEGPFKGHAPTNELVQLFGMGIFTLDESMKIEKVEFFYDVADLVGPLIKGPPWNGSASTSSSPGACPFLNKLGSSAI